MIVRFYTNACCTYEIPGYRLLADPWLSPTAFEGSWEHDPPITTRPEDLADVDALYISHIHEDHCDPATLKHFRRDIPIFVLRDEHQFLARHLGRMGFTLIVLCDPMQGYEIAEGLRIRIFPPFVAHPFHGAELGNLIDSALYVEHEGGGSALNCNDNTPTVDAAAMLRHEFGAPTLAQINYNCAGPYPACFVNLTDDERRAEANRLVRRNLRHMGDVAEALGARYVMPFAGAFRASGDKAHLNPYLGTTTAQAAGWHLELRGFRPVVLGEGETVDVGGLA